MFRKIVLLVTLPLCSFARPLTLEEKLSDFNQVLAIMKSQYGPYEYKRRMMGIDAEKMLSQYATRLPATNNTQFYYLINQFVAEFKDSHFASLIQTNRVSTLGFFVDRVEGKAIIEKVDRNQLSWEKYPFERGDEVISIDEKPVNELSRELGSYLGSGYAESQHRIGTIFLSYRSGTVLPTVSGTARVVLKRFKSGALETYSIDWKQTDAETDDEWRIQIASLPNYGEISIFNLDDVLPKSEANYRCSGKTRISIPEKATVLMNEPFVSYYYPTERGNVGYLRIPHYYWLNKITKKSENEARFLQYEWAVEQLEKNTAGLIIDQDHNCGGMVNLVEKMVGLFAEKDYLGLSFQFLATRNEYFLFKQWMEEGAEHTILGASLLKVLDLIKTTWIQGQNRLTSRSTFQANRLIRPHTVRYTKPIVVLIDDLSGSGGDAFPAMMQGIGRAKLLGTRTMGAGGHVVQLEQPLNYSGNKLHLTKSLFYHPNGTPIENNGATPDIDYKITHEDFVNGYQKYRTFYTQKLLELVK